MLRIVHYAALCLVRKFRQGLSAKETVDSRAGRMIVHLQKSQCK